MKPACRALSRLVESYLDGELEPSRLVEVEHHSRSCETCRERIVLDQAIRVSVRRVVRQSRPSDGFRARAEASVAAQRWAPKVRRAGSIVPTVTSWLFAAAAVVLAVLGVQGRIRRPLEVRAQPAEPVSASIGIDQMIDQFVDWHARPLPPEITNPDDLPGFEPYVGVPVRPPVLSPFGARLLGGRILPVQEQHATAMLQYTMGGGHRISLYVYDPHRILTSPSRLHAKVVGTEPVYIGQVRGWSVAATERHGVGYAIASDLGDDESVELALAAAPSR